MLDICTLQLTLELRHILSDDFIVITANDVEEEQTLIDFFPIRHRVFELLGGSPKDHPDLARSASPVNYVHGEEPPMLVVHGIADQLVPYLQAELFVAAMDKVGAPYYFHTVVGGGHNPYFGLKFDSTGKSFNSGGGGIGLFEDPLVEPIIKGFLRHYLLKGKKDLFTGLEVTRPEEHHRGPR
jgi:Prolyl oligopeptidase family